MLRRQAHGSMRLVVVAVVAALAPWCDASPVLFYNLRPTTSAVCFTVTSNSEETTIGPLSFGDRYYAEMDTGMATYDVVAVTEASACAGSTVLATGEIDVVRNKTNMVGWGSNSSGYAAIDPRLDAFTAEQSITFGYEPTDSSVAVYANQALGFDTCWFKARFWFGDWLRLGESYAIDIECDEWNYLRNLTISVRCDDGENLVDSELKFSLDDTCKDASHYLVATGDADDLTNFPLEIKFLQAADPETCDHCEEIPVVREKDDEDDSGGDGSKSKNKSTVTVMVLAILLVAVVVCCLGYLAFRCRRRYCSSEPRYEATENKGVDGAVMAPMKIDVA